MQLGILQTVSRRAQLKNWLAEPKHTANLWLGKPSVVTAWLGLVLALASPPHGLDDIQLCWLHSATGIPCLGCGLTRSLSCALRGMFVEGWNYHPMGLLVLTLFIMTAAHSLLPRQLRDRLQALIEAHAFIFNACYLVFVTAFIAYGGGRVLVYCFLRLVVSAS